MRELSSAGSTSTSSSKDIDKDTTLGEKNVRIHTAKTAPKEKKLRHVKHDDCCGYCERYCEDKITDIKRREIEAWRHDITHIMETRKTRHSQKPNLKFLAHNAARSPDTEPGFMRIKTPKDVKRQATYNPVTIRSPYKWRNSGRASEMLQSPRMVDLSIHSDYSNIEHGEEYSKSLVPVNRSPAVISPTFSRDSLDITSEVSSLADEEIIMPSSQHSYRSYSNQLLNVVTIDDAMMHHREMLLQCNNIRAVESGRRPRNSPHTHKRTGISMSTQPPSRHLALPNAAPHQPVTQESEFRLHQDHNKVVSRPTTRYSSVAMTESTDLQMAKPMTAMSNTSHQQSSHYRHAETPSHRGPMAAIHKAVNQIIGDRNLHDDQLRRGLYHKTRTMLPAKPESRRFRKMNDHLRNLMMDDYIPNHKMAARLNQHKPHHDPYAYESKGLDCSMTGTYMEHDTNSGNKSYTDATIYTSHNTIHRNSQEDHFLGLLTEYQDPAISVN